VIDRFRNAAATQENELPKEGSAARHKALRGENGALRKYVCRAAFVFMDKGRHNRFVCNEFHFAMSSIWTKPVV